MPKLSPLIAIIATIGAGIVGNILASLLQTVASQHPFIRRIGDRRLLFVLVPLFIILSLPAGVREFNSQSIDVTATVQQANRSTRVAEGKILLQKNLVGKWRSQVADALIITEFFDNGTYSIYHVCIPEGNICSQKWLGRYKVIDED